MQNSKKTLIAAAALTLLAALPGHAQERGLYVGAAIGQSNVKWDEGGYAQRLVGSGYRSATTTSSRDGTAWRLYGGYRYGPHLAAEAGFTRFAKSGIDAVVGTGAGSSTGTVNGDTSIEPRNRSCHGCQTAQIECWRGFPGDSRDCGAVPHQ